ncbi:homoserine/homoserine lactone efflux protein [mine drainage metagenome]|uniref:Homoserine/homoserine lactone efflux protein n=1 Tax=mine drainage metagenome TaxID=410659 RepID=A0A1J5RQE9_9ZZZZ
MNPHTWLLYVVTVGVISAIPGPNMLLVMSHGARHGWRRSTATMAGCLSALLVMISISAAGLGVFLQAWPRLFDTLRLIGAAYLVYLGIKTWRAASHATTLAEPAPEADGDAHRLHTPAALFRNGFLVASSNPKAILFAAALLPQFMSPTAHWLLQFVVLVGTFATIEVSWYFIYAGFGARLGTMLRGAKVARVFHRLTGGIFMGFGAAMAAFHN